MAKKNRYKGKSQQEIEAIKMQRQSSLMFVLMFMVIIIAGVMMAAGDSCGQDVDDELGIVSGASVEQTVSGADIQ